MSLRKILDAAMSAYEQKFHDFCQSEGLSDSMALSPQLMSTLTNGLLAAAANAGQAGLQQYLSEHDQRTASITRGSSKYRFKNRMSKTFLTLFGEVTIQRCIYGNDQRGDRYIAPLDQALGVGPDEYATLETREMILFAAAFNTPQEVETMLKKMALCQPSRTAIQNIIAKDGAAMELHRDSLRQAALQQKQFPTEATILVQSMDGTNIRLREVGAKKGRKAQRPRNEPAPSCVSAFRNVVVGSFSFYKHDDENRPVRTDSTYLARMPEENAPTFKQHFEDMASRLLRNPGLQSPIDKIFLADGAKGIWKYVENTPLYSDYHHLLDFYHATEHLSKAAEAVHGKSSAFATAYFNKYREKLKSDPDAPTAITRSLEGYQKRLNLPKARRDALKAEITFFKNNKRYMKYAEFITKGWPIGSGPVEAAGKTIVKQRMCRSGMRWDRTKGQHILSVRTYVVSGLWDQLWESYVDLKMAA